MATKYRFTLKSTELVGASGYNGVYIELGNAADALIFATNLESVCSADCVSVDEELSTNYALPYPAGTSNVVRMIMRDAMGAQANAQLYNVTNSFVPETFAAGLIGAGILHPITGNPIVSIVCTLSTPTASH